MWRYTENNLSIFVNFPATSRIARTQSYLLAEAGWLLYHELAHASDFLPPSERSRLNDNLGLTAWGFIEPLFSSGRLPSAVLSATSPLQSAEMSALAQVKFFGATPTDLQKSYTPHQVASFFAPDGATDEYNYATIREDLAMLFEEFMMFRNSPDPAARWRRDVAITDKITRHDDQFDADRALGPARAHRRGGAEDARAARRRRARAVGSGLGGAEPAAADPDATRRELGLEPRAARAAARPDWRASRRSGPRSISKAIARC